MFLKLLLGWPESLFTWDILFLIPVPWVGPVLAPVLVSLTMIGVAVLAVQIERSGLTVRFGGPVRAMWWIGCTLILISFVWDYTGYVQDNQQVLWTASSRKDLFSEATGYVPEAFNWGLFGLGEALLLAGTAGWIRQTLLQIPGRKFSSGSKRFFVNPDAEGFSDYLNGL